MSAKILLVVGATLFLTACSTAAPASDQARRRPLTEGETCAMLADVARQVGEGPFDPDVGSIDCQDTFKAAGLTLFPASRMNDPRVGIATRDRGYVFKTPQFIDDTKALIPMDFVCRNLCGHGEELTVELRGGRWQITNRRTTWMS